MSNELAQSHHDHRSENGKHMVKDKYSRLILTTFITDFEMTTMGYTHVGKSMDAQRQ